MSPLAKRLFVYPIVVVATVYATFGFMGLRMIARDCDMSCDFYEMQVRDPFCIVDPFCVSPFGPRHEFNKWNGPIAVNAYPPTTVDYIALPNFILFCLLGMIVAALLSERKWRLRSALIRISVIAIPTLLVVIWSALRTFYSEFESMKLITAILMATTLVIAAGILIYQDEQFVRTVLKTILFTAWLTMSALILAWQVSSFDQSNQLTMLAVVLAFIPLFCIWIGTKLPLATKFMNKNHAY